MVLHRLAGTVKQARNEVVNTLDERWNDIVAETGLTEVTETKQARLSRMRTPQNFGEGFAEREEVFAAALRYHVAFLR